MLSLHDALPILQPPVAADSIYLDPPASMSEDCLTLNVWAPASARKAPVVVWIHGGSLRIGGGAQPLQDGSNRSEEHTYELPSLMRFSYAVLCLKKNKITKEHRLRQLLHE